MKERSITHVFFCICIASIRQVQFVFQEPRMYKVLQEHMFSLIVVKKLTRVFSNERPLVLPNKKKSELMKSE